MSFKATASAFSDDLGYIMPTVFLLESLSSPIWVNKARERTKCIIKKLSDRIWRDMGKKMRTPSQAIQDTADQLKTQVNTLPFSPVTPGCGEKQTSCHIQGTIKKVLQKITKIQYALCNSSLRCPSKSNSNCIKCMNI